METELFSLVAITFLFIEAEPLILFKRYLGFREEEYDSMSKLKRYFHKLITCHLCSGFWIGLAFTGSLYQAVLVSVLSELLKKIMSL